MSGGAILGVFGIQHITQLSKIDVEPVKFEGRNESHRNKLRSKCAQQQSTMLVERGSNASAVRHPGDFAFFLLGECQRIFLVKKMAHATNVHISNPGVAKREPTRQGEHRLCIRLSLLGVGRMRRRFSDSHGKGSFLLVKIGYGL